MEAEALVKWKASLDEKSRSNLSSWVGTGSSPCTWVGISCDTLGSVTYLNLSHNGLEGTLEDFNFSSFPNLTHLDLTFNSLFGNIPAQIGPIPTSIGNLTNTLALYLRTNKLSGLIPQQIGLLTSIQELDFSQNCLTGSIPHQIGNLTNLSALSLLDNRLWGSLPHEMNNIVNLKSLALAYNNFTGSLPHNICRGGLLRNLTIADNDFTGPIPKSLTNCTSLFRLRLDANRFTGNISETFGIYPNLNYIDLSGNQLYGELTWKWGECRNLTVMKFSNNNISGEIPPNLGKMAKLQRLDLSLNNLIGRVPKGMGSLTLLLDLSVQGNQLSGIIPPTIGMLHDLQILNLAANNLSGSLTKQIGNCSKLQFLNLSFNRFTGTIPFEIGGLGSLETIDVSQNMLTGVIPSELGNLPMLETLNLSHNMLFGSIPSTFEYALSGLTTVNVSFNQLEGPIPNIKAFREASCFALQRNKGLCGNNTCVKACVTHVASKRALIITLLLSLSGALLFLLIFIVCLVALHRRNKTKVEQRQGENNAHDSIIFGILGHDGKRFYEDIIKATDEFNSDCCIATGGHSKVYRAVLSSGQVVAVKKLHVSEESGELIDVNAFKGEVVALTNIRHRNIVKLFGFCPHAKHPFLIYDFIEKGSLRVILNDDKEAMEFDWKKRLNVVRGVANALTYMHHDCSPPIVHRDISSNNVLLDSEWDAHVSDFGTARFLKPDSSYLTSPAGTFGYMAPDHRLRPPFTNRVAEGIVSTMQLAFACLNAVPQYRPTMKNISSTLATQPPPLSKPFSMIELGELIAP
ncbi:hypothetical protein COLO4_33616 [Corchorus olitorius]|uniref:non-specific serine/threonine protein kinase n=1 Tax=Corchorus olitorius TaxID=93759 RepID=A0A1R3GSH3_9ROSI|nr:hypothetical protein COLO4_33616 [Corchorus olitorius]